MKNVFLVLFSLLGFFGYAQNFEGVINLTMTNELVGEDTKIIWHKKGGNHHLEVNSNVGEYAYSYVFLIKENDLNIYLLADLEGRKTVYKIPGTTMKPALDRSLIGAKEIGESKEEKVGEFNCVKMEVSNHEAVVNYWLTNDLTIKLSDFPPFLQEANYFKYLEKNNTTAFPIKITSANADGQVEYTQSITKVNPKKIDNQLFVIPSDYEMVTSE